MKRAKIMLLAIAIIAGVGGALAFKAQKFSKKNIYCSTNVGSRCVTVTFQTTPIDDVIPVTTPCSTYHELVGGNGTPSTTQYYTTSTCPQSFNNNVWPTNDN